ncbi:hypothetical protein, partial [Nitrosomonas communis]|uniref:hypothetical protein n=1 Tax=Nitrosomonas communis TaxID=44574 RepID=UPI001C430FF7
VPSRNALTCATVCSFASSMSITMPRIMTNSESNCSDSFLVGNTHPLQTHFILEETIPLLQLGHLWIVSAPD